MASDKGNLDSIGRATQQLRSAWNADAPSNVPSELVFNEKFERCAENMLITGSAGLFAGVVASMVLFRSPRMRGFATGLGTGVGIGSSYTTCKYKVYGAKGNATPTKETEKTSASA